MTMEPECIIRLWRDGMGWTYDWTPFHYGFKNPIKFTDLDGNTESTHTDSSGDEVAVFDDGDNGVYRHNDITGSATEENIAKITNRHENLSPINSASGEKMGSTEYVDEFNNPETGKVMTNVRIEFGKSWEPLIRENNKETQGMNLIEIVENSRLDKFFDKKLYKCCEVIGFKVGNISFCWQLLGRL